MRDYVKAHKGPYKGAPLNLNENNYVEVVPPSQPVIDVGIL